jgi:TM2 domain-containing membrane protein YozV
MKKVFILFVLIILGLSAFAQNKEYRDAVYLKNGSVIKGIIIEQIPNQSLKISTADGSTFVFQMTEVEKIAKEEVTTTNNNNYNNKDKETQTSATSYRNPSIAWLCSFLLPGVGQFYNGQTGKGVGHLLWYLGSTTLWIVGIENMTTTSYNYDYYSDYYDDTEEINDGWMTIAIAGGISSLVCWIISQTDAPRNARHINEENNFMSFNLSKKVNLSFVPEVKPVFMPATNNVAASYGAGIKLSF